MTGGAAIGLQNAGVADGHRRLLAAEDLDFVAAHIDAVRPTVVRDFLVSHFHSLQPDSPRFLIQLVDPHIGVRVDVFFDSLGGLGRAQCIVVGGLEMRVLRAHDILAHKLVLLSKASAVAPVERKHYADARLLGAGCRRTVPAVPGSHLTESTLSQNLDEVCLRCQASEHDSFPLASKQAIFDVLGYV